MAELAAVAALGLLAAFGVRVLSHHEPIIAPELILEPAVEGAGLRRAWKLIAFEPAEPLSVKRAALLGRLRSSLVVAFDGHTAQASAVNGAFARSYSAKIAADSTIELDLGEGHATTLHYRWDGDALLVIIPSGAWAGVARLTPAAR